MAPNPYDQASRYAAKLDPPGFLRWLIERLPPSVAFRSWLDTRTLPFPGEPDRVCDTVAGLSEPTATETWWALAIEFQRRPAAEMFGRLLEYLARLWLELRPPERPAGRYNLAAAVVNLTGTGQSSRSMELGATGLRTCLRVAERNLTEEDAAATLAEIAAGQVARCLLPWVPLMRGGAESGIIELWKRLAEAEADERRRADYGGLALVFAELTGSRQVWKRGLEGWAVEQSQQVLEWQAEAHRKGEEKGMERGKAEGKADSILRLLERRFSTRVPAELEAAIRATTDLGRLDNWFDAALTAASLDEFRACLSS